MGVQYCKTHIFPYTILVIIILGKHFPQTRRSLDRDQVKACLLNKIKFCSRENQLKTDISIFGALARLLSDRGASFTSSVIEELCKILGIKQLQTMPYHPQTNRLVERSHETIMCMIRKLGEDKKANWPSHLAEIVHTSYAT